MKHALLYFTWAFHPAAAVCLTLLLAGAAWGAENIGLNRQLFVDDAIIAGKTNVNFTLHQPTKHTVGGMPTPVIVADKPWETGSIALYGTTVYDEQDKQYKMWYRAFGDTCYICYATSTDGVAWTKPNLGLTTFQGSTANNIVAGFSDFYTDGFGVYKDLADPDPARRYKMFTYYSKGTIKDRFATLTSADGLSWNLLGVSATTQTTGDVVSLYFDTGLNKYVGLTKKYISGKRSRQITYSDNFSTWTAPATILTPDAQDPATAHLYSHVAYMYEGMRIGYVSVFDTATQRIDSQLVSSRDGLAWNRYRQRTPFIPNGAPGTFDAGTVIAGGSGLIVDDEKISIYYTGWNVDHNGAVVG